jgi:hypothetical protein
LVFVEITNHHCSVCTFSGLLDNFKVCVARMLGVDFMFYGQPSAAFLMHTFRHLMHALVYI